MKRLFLAAALSCAACVSTTVTAGGTVDTNAKTGLEASASIGFGSKAAHNEMSYASATAGVQVGERTRLWLGDELSYLIARDSSAVRMGIGAGITRTGTGSTEGFDFTTRLSAAYYLWCARSRWDKGDDHGWSDLKAGYDEMSCLGPQLSLQMIAGDENLALVVLSFARESFLVKD